MPSRLIDGSHSLPARLRKNSAYVATRHSGPISITSTSVVPGAR